jgi:hypothetical protein
MSAMNMPIKPRKYGKIMVLNDAKIHYFLNANIYSGKNSDELTLSKDKKKKKENRLYSYDSKHLKFTTHRDAF